jgi:hypothetical protein
MRTITVALRCTAKEVLIEPNFYELIEFRTREKEVMISSANSVHLLAFRALAPLAATPPTILC